MSIVAAPRTSSRSAPSSTRAALSPHVHTSSGVVGMSRPVSCSATDSGSRDALFVTKTSRIPRPRAAVRPSDACSIGSCPRYATPSRSTSARS
ncbi:Uncharacterised protein [Mycobacteroides abscessus]|nr:Uncharacterised protein [Mycobacteroides abscessus]